MVCVKGATTPKVAIESATASFWNVGNLMIVSSPSCPGAFSSLRHQGGEQIDAYTSIIASFSACKSRPRPAASFLGRVCWAVTAASIAYGRRLVVRVPFLLLLGVRHRRY